MRISSPVRLRMAVCVLLVWGCAHASAQPSPEHVIRQALSQRLLAGASDSTLREAAVPPADVRRIVTLNLDTGLSGSLVSSAGTEFRFNEPQQRLDSQVSVLVLIYPNHAVALRMNRSLAKRGGYFTGTKILTRFSSVPVRNQLVIVFTENAGNDAVVKFIDAVPRLFD
jgi:hypothetical protein